MPKTMLRAGGTRIGECTRCVDGSRGATMKINDEASIDLGFRIQFLGIHQKPISAATVSLMAFRI